MGEKQGEHCTLLCFKQKPKEKVTFQLFAVANKHTRRKLFTLTNEYIREKNVIHLADVLEEN